MSAKVPKAVSSTTLPVCTIVTGASRSVFSITAASAPCRAKSGSPGPSSSTRTYASMRRAPSAASTAVAPATSRSLRPRPPTSHTCSGDTRSMPDTWTSASRSGGASVPSGRVQRCSSRATASATTLTAASIPERSPEGSASAMPASCASLRLCAMLLPSAIPCSTTPVVELRQPRKLSSCAPPGAKPPRQSEKRGTPSMTADSCR